MNDSDWDKLQRMFHTALALVPDLRAAYLRRCCRGNPALRSRLERMLAAAEGDLLPLDLPPAGRAGPRRRRDRGR